MRDTPQPLSIAFFDGAGRYVSSTDMAPCGTGTDCPTYAARSRVPRGRGGATGPSRGAGRGAGVDAAARARRLPGRAVSGARTRRTPALRG